MFWVGLSEHRIQTVLFHEALELINSIMEDDGELGLWLEVTFDFILKDFDEFLMNRAFHQLPDFWIKDSPS
jgi:hypothetical protein